MTVKVVPVDTGTYDLLVDAANRRGITLMQYMLMLSGIEELKQIEESKNENRK